MTTDLEGRDQIPGQQMMIFIPAHFSITPCGGGGGRSPFCCEVGALGS